MSKFLCLGMALAEVVRRSIVNAGFALQRPEYGSLKPGSLGDATILTVEDGEFDYVDTTGAHMTGAQRIVPAGVVLKGA